jgi:hypothetical protein
MMLDAAWLASSYGLGANSPKQIFYLLVSTQLTSTLFPVSLLSNGGICLGMNYSVSNETKGDEY